MTEPATTSASPSPAVIDAPVHQVFTAITDRHAISTYFTDASSGPLVTRRTTVYWRFGDLEIDVKVEEVHPQPPHRLQLARRQGKSTTELNSASPSKNKATAPSSTSAKPAGAATTPGLASAFDQCSGWTHFFASLKARLEHNVPPQALLRRTTTSTARA